jgi:hypothetical protein
MSIQTLAPGLVELSANEATDRQGGIVFAAALLIPWMGKAFIAGVTLGAGAAAAYYSQQ